MKQEADIQRFAAKLHDTMSAPRTVEGLSMLGDALTTLRKAHAGGLHMPTTSGPCRFELSESCDSMMRALDITVSADDSVQLSVVQHIAVRDGRFQLPGRLPQYMGRAAELSRLKEEAKANDIAICGEPFTGKTTLAIMLAHELKDQYPDGQIFMPVMNVYGTHSTECILRRVIWSICPDLELPESLDDLREIYLRELQDRHVLILLDYVNPDFDYEATKPPATCRLILESRNLEISRPGIYVHHQVAEIDPGAARDLVLYVAPRVGKLAEDLAARCQFSPYALRVSAALLAQFPDLPVEDYLEQWDEASDDYYNEEYPGTDHADFIAELLDSRYVTRELTGLIDDLGVYAGEVPFSLIRGVMGERNFETVLQLEKLSLIDVDFEQGLARLSSRAFEGYWGECTETEAETSRERLQDLLLRHSEYCLTLLGWADRCCALGGETRTKGLALFDSMWVEMLEAQESAQLYSNTGAKAACLCLEYGRQAQHIGPARLQQWQWVDWLSAAADAAGVLNRTPEELALRSQIASILFRSGDVPGAIAQLAEMVTARCRTGDDEGLWQAQVCLGAAYLIEKNTPAAKRILNQSLKTARSGSSPLLEGYSLWYLGHCWNQAKDRRKAVGFLECSKRVFETAGDRSAMASILVDLGYLFSEQGEYHQAIELLQQSLVIMRDIGEISRECEVLNVLGATQNEVGDHDLAIETLDCSLQLARLSGNSMVEMNCLINLGIAHGALDDIERAIELFETAYTLARVAHHRGVTHLALANLAVAYSRLGDPQRAIDLSKRALDGQRELGDKEGEVATLTNLAIAYRAQGDLMNAVEVSERAHQLGKSINDPVGIVFVSINVAMYLADMGRLDNAISHAMEADTLLQHIDRPDLRRATTGLIEQFRQKLDSGTSIGRRMKSEPD